MFDAILGALGLSIFCTLAILWYLDSRADRAALKRAKRPAPVTIAPQPGRLPRCVAIPSAVRDGKWSA